MKSKIHLFICVVVAVLFASCTPDEAKDQKAMSDGPNEFSLIESGQSGISFNNELTETYDNFYYYFNYVYNGAGVAAGDLDGDGLSDLYFVANMGQDRIYKNLGDFKFEDVTNQSGIGTDTNWHTGVTMVDINGDGLLDIYVCRGEYKDEPSQRTNLLYINKGGFKFSEEAKKYGLDDEGYSMHANFFDADNDGDLDAYIMNRPEEWHLKTSQVLEGRTSGKPYEKDHFYLNDGNGNFKDVSIAAGFGQNFGYGLSCTTLDANNDGYLDIYVANDFLENDYLYINQGDATFKQEIKKHTNHNAYFAMGTDVQDLNNDGFEEIYTVEMLPDDYWRSKVNMTRMISMEGFDQLFDGGKFHHQYMHNALQMNNGNGFFSEISQYSHIQKTDWSWACLLSDFDNDGLRDIYVTNGYRRDVFDRDESTRLAELVEKTYTDKAFEKEFQENIKKYLKVIPENPLANRAFRNEGDFHFSKTEKDWNLNHKSYSNGAVTADLDNDGDLDLVVNNIDAEAFVYRNDLRTENHLRVKLNGSALNTYGIGAKITLKAGDKIWVDNFKTVRGYHSSVEPIAHFGLGSTGKIDELIVEWPQGKISRLKGIATNQTITVDYKEAVNDDSVKDEPTPLFAEITAQNFKQPFQHVENYYMDFAEQILLPHRLSENGPALAVGDVNGDNLQDFYIGGASKQSGAIYIQDENSHFSRTIQPLITQDIIDEDVAATFVDIDKDGDLDLYVVSGGFEFDPTKYGYQDRLYVNDGKGNFNKKMAVAAMNISGSCAINEDVDGDGIDEIFVGGRVVPNKYPLPTTSFLLKGHKDQLGKVSEAITKELVDLGMVTDAVFMDINGDNSKELIVVGEWLPITVFTFQEGRLQNITKELGLENTSGWWNSISKADIDGDGDEDLLCGNLGLNYKFSASEEKPFHVYADDFDENGSYDIVLAKYASDKLVPVRGRDCTSEQMPYIAEKFPTFRDFAKADVHEILDHKEGDALHLDVKMFESVILENKGGSFAIHQLPWQAQLAPIRGSIIEDFTGDGQLDILIGGNMFGAENETTRADAGTGLLLRGKGNFEFEPLSPVESGFFIPYDVRHLRKVALSGGKSGVLVASNDDILRLFIKN